MKQVSGTPYGLIRSFWLVQFTNQTGSPHLAHRPRVAGDIWIVQEMSYTRERENLRQNWRERAYAGETPGKFKWFPV